LACFFLSQHSLGFYSSRFADGSASTKGTSRKAGQHSLTLSEDEMMTGLEHLGAELEWVA
jgi:hypothetical protein